MRGKIYFPDHLPPYPNILTDEEGRIFVETYEKGEREGEVILDIFDPEGAFISRKSLKKFQSGIFKNDSLYCVYQKDSDFPLIVSDKVVWTK